MKIRNLRKPKKVVLFGAIAVAVALIALPAFARWWVNPDEKGALVASVDPDGPAAAAGLRRADVIVEVNGAEIGGLRDLWSAISDSGVDDQLEMVVLGGGQQRAVTVTVGETDEGRPYLGILLGILLGPDGRNENTFGQSFGGYHGGRHGAHGFQFRGRGQPRVSPNTGAQPSAQAFGQAFGTQSI